MTFSVEIKLLSRAHQFMPFIWLHYSTWLLLTILYQCMYDAANIITMYAPMIYTAPCVRFFMWADRLRGEVGEGGGGLALEIESFVGPCEIARAEIS